MFIRRGRHVYLRTAPAGEPVGTGAPAAPAPAPAEPAAPVAVPAAFDPASAPAEVKAYIDAERRRIASDEAAKARLGSKATARAETLEEIAKALGLKPGEVDPAEVARQLDAARGETRQLKIDRALDRAARALKADEDLVGAVLARTGKLADLDPTAVDFEDKIKALVEEAVTANPRLKLEITPAPVAPGGQAPVNGGFNGQPAAGARLPLAQAIAAHYNK